MYFTTGGALEGNCRGPDVLVLWCIFTTGESIHEYYKFNMAAASIKWMRGREEFGID